MESTGYFDIVFTANKTSIVLGLSQLMLSSRIKTT